MYQLTCIVPNDAVALSARLNVNVEHPLESLRPGHGRVTISRRFVLRLISRLKLVAFASLCGRYQRAMLAIGCEYTVISGEVDSWLGHQGRQPGNEIQRLEDYVSSAVPIRSFDVQGRTNAVGAGCAGTASS